MIKFEHTHNFFHLKFVRILLNFPYVASRDGEVGSSNFQVGSSFLIKPTQFVWQSTVLTGTISAKQMKTFSCPSTFCLKQNLN